MILADHHIEEECGKSVPLIEPFKPEHLQPASVDLTLSDLFLKLDFSPGPIQLPDVPTPDRYQYYKQDVYHLGPQEFILGSTAEKVNVPTNMVARVEGKSSLGRIGLLVHATAGYCDPGFSGNITLEMYNLNHKTISLRADLAICQVSFVLLSDEARRPYGHKELDSKYQGQTTPTPSRYTG